MDYYYVVAFGHGTGKVQNPVQGAADLRRIIDAACEKIGGFQDICPSIAPMGVMLAFKRDNPQFALKICEAVANYLEAQARSHSALTPVCAVITYGQMRKFDIPGQQYQNFEGPPAIIAARILAKLQPGEVAIEFSLYDLFRDELDRAVQDKRSIAGKHAGEQFIIFIHRRISFPTTPYPPPPPPPPLDTLWRRIVYRLGKETWQWRARSVLSLLLLGVTLFLSSDGAPLLLIYTNSIDMKFVPIPAGKFFMGSTCGESDEQPVHEVSMSAFYLGQYEVTQGQWETVMGNNPSLFPKDSLRPVENVSWDMVQQFIEKLNERLKKDKFIYRLPSEAEWEYAARAGSSAVNDCKPEDRQLQQYAWCAQPGIRETKPIGQLQPNKWQLYDMLGNVSEWVEDYWSQIYLKDAVRDPHNRCSTGQSCVLRGGNWNSRATERCRTTDRNYDISNKPAPYYGFRLVRQLSR